jgi:predicted nucleotidyltransferase
MKNSDAKLKMRFKTILQRANSRILKENPSVLGIILDGSVGRGDMGPYSDVDIIVLTKPKSNLRKLFYFDDGVQVDVWFMGIDSYDKKPKGNNAYYARGSQYNKILFDKNGSVKKMLARRASLKPSKEDIDEMLECSCRNLLEYAGKAKNGNLSRNWRLVRYSARMIAEASQNPILISNDIRMISENLLWNQLIAAKKRPEHFAIDYPVCFGLEGVTDTGKVYKSAMRLAKESLLFVELEFGNRITADNVKAMLSYRSESDIV